MARPQSKVKPINRSVRSVLIAVATATLALMPATASFAGAPASTTGCPASNEVLVVEDLLALGYQLPAVVDSEGNGNGLVCGKPLNPVVQERLCPALTCPVPVIYLFRDDTLTR